MQIKADYSGISRYKNNYATNKKDVTFEGLNFGRLFSRSKTSVPSERSYRNFASEIGVYLGIKTEKIIPRINRLDQNAMDFLSELSRKYSDINFYLQGSLKEDPELVFKVLDAVKNPKDYHYRAISACKSERFGYISRLFSTAQDKESLDFAVNFQRNVINRGVRSENMVIEMLQSPYKKQYINNIDEYKSYIILNADNPEAIKELDLLLQNHQYDRKLYDIRLTVERILNCRNMTSSRVFTQDNIEKYYTKSGAKFLDSFAREYYVKRNFQLSAKSELEVLDIFRSTTKDNVQSRIGIINKFNNVAVKSPEGTEAEISAMKNLFELMDSDRHAMKFVDKLILNDHVHIESVAKLLEILKELTPRKADIFSDNVFRVLRRVEGDELISVLKEQYNNPFFETKSSRYHKEQMIRYGYKSPESYFSKLKRTIMNKFNEIKYARSEKQVEKQAQSIGAKPVIAEFKTVASEQGQLVQNTVELPIIEKAVEKAVPFEWNTQKALPLERQIVSEDKEPVIKLVNTVKESPKARKLRLIGEVNELISKKLGAKTVEKQGDVYSKNATKMRLKMLPEIFDSIKETRQADRAVGKLRSASANKDAVDLYRLINGSNRKYIKYLLEKRNADGTRMFEVRDIISIIEKANKKVDAMKKANPDFKAKDAKAYFDHLYEAKVEQYGKVKKAKKKL